MRNRLGNPQPFFSEGPAFSEHAEFGMAPGKPGTGLYGGEECPVEELVAPHPLEGLHDLLKAVERPTKSPWNW